VQQSSEVKDLVQGSTSGSIHIYADEDMGYAIQGIKRRLTDQNSNAANEVSMIPVKVHFYRGTGFIGRAIRFFSWGEQSHVAMQINNTLYEAKEFHGVIRTKYPEAAQRKPDWTIDTRSG